MNRLLLFLLLALPLAAADKINIIVPASYTGDAAVSRQPLTLTATAPLPRTYGTNVFSRQPVTQRTDTNGVCTFSNVLWGYYRLDIPGNPGTSYGLVVGTNLSGTVNVVTLITNGASMPPSPQTNYLTEAQSDARYATAGAAGVFTAAGTNVTAQTNGNVVTINADVSTASVAVKANTNAPTLFNMTTIGGRLSGSTNVSVTTFVSTNAVVEPVVLVVPDDVDQSFYLGTVFPGSVGPGTFSIGNRNDADGHYSFIAGNANITYAHNSTVVGNANDVGNALNGEKNVVIGQGNAVSQDNTNVVVVGVVNNMLTAGKTNLIAIGFNNSVTATLAGAIGFNLDNSTLGTIDIGLDNTTKASIGQTVARFRTPISSAGATNTDLTASRVIYSGADKQERSVSHTGIVLGDGTQAAAANVYGLWTGTGTYMTRFGTNANVSAGSGETNLQRVLQVGSNANGENATNFGTISATNATFENFNVENQYTTNHYVTSLTSGRVVLATTGGQLTDHSGFTYNTGTGNLSVQGSVTAESFVGDGSALTDLNASEISSGTLAAARLGHEYLSNGHTASITFSNASTILRGTLQVAGAAAFTNDVTARAALKVTGPAQITNTIYQSFAVNELATTGNETNYTADFYATNTQTILATGNVYIASLDNLAAGRWKQLIITNVFKASSNITAYVQTNLLWLGPTNGYALGASPMHTNRAYPVTNVLVLSLQAIGSTAPSVLGYGIQSSP